MAGVHGCTCRWRSSCRLSPLSSSGRVGSMAAQARVGLPDLG